MTANTFKMNLNGNEKEFFRLMGLPLPVPELYRHYLDMLSEEDRYLKEKVEKFNEYAKWCVDMGHKSVQSYRLDHALGVFIKWTKANDLLLDIQYPDVKFQEKDHRGAHVNEGLAPRRGSRKSGMIGAGNRLGTGNKPLISFDLKEANYSVLRLGAKQKGVKIPQDWAGFCDEVLRLHPFLATSKIFRQYCFGNYAPKTVAKVQGSLVQALVDKFDLYDKAVAVSSDEIVMPYEKEASDQLHNDIYYFLQDSEFSGAMGVKTTLYEMYRLKGDVLLRVIYDTGREEEVKRQLFAAPASKHYMFFRVHVLEQSLQENDKLFLHDGDVARWVM